MFVCGVVFFPSVLCNGFVHFQAWYGREIKSALLRHEGDSSAGVDMGEEQGEQVMRKSRGNVGFSHGRASLGGAVWRGQHCQAAVTQ